MLGEYTFIIVVSSSWTERLIIMDIKDRQTYRKNQNTKKLASWTARNAD